MGVIRNIIDNISFKNNNVSFIVIPDKNPIESKYISSDIKVKGTKYYKLSTCYSTIDSDWTPKGIITGERIDLYFRVRYDSKQKMESLQSFIDTLNDGIVSKDSNNVNYVINLHNLLSGSMDFVFEKVYKDEKFAFLNGNMQTIMHFIGVDKNTNLYEGYLVFNDSCVTPRYKRYIIKHFINSYIKLNKPAR